MLVEKVHLCSKTIPRPWDKRFNSFMISHNFLRCTYDSCVHFKRCDNGSFIYLLLYIDDILIIAKGKEEIQKVKVIKSLR